ncbi:MAG: long-chain fatty acid--CoA ligase, partial [Gemmatimonadota bacterium]|nr:long-chain fatty acid--CoA ligase [Gemmatimonadota bacterium]
MRGRMMEMPLLVSSLVEHAGGVYGDQAVVSRNTDGAVHRYSWRDVRDRSRGLSGALAARGITAGDRLATLAWNNHRHLEIYYGVSGMGAVCHTLNPRLHPAELAFVLNHAEDRILFLDTTFVPLAEAIADKLPRVEAYVVLTGPEGMPETKLPNAVAYEDLLSGAEGGFTWPTLDEHDAASLCYTSGTTGNPKGVLYSHRSTVLHAMAISMPDVFMMGSRESVLPVVPMFHANAWGIPYSAALTGTKLVLPGPRLDPTGLTELLTDEGVTCCAGVPSVFIPLLQHWRDQGVRPPALERVLIGGSAPPRSLIAALEGEFGIEFLHGWGMTETSPLGSVNRVGREWLDRGVEERSIFQTKQGRPPFGVELRIVDDQGAPLPHDGTAGGELQIRGPWVAAGYFRDDTERLTSDGWFPTGDVATIDAQGYMQITDRTKDLIKSGGEWISSIDVENMAMGHPEISMAAVIGVPDERWG